MVVFVRPLYHVLMTYKKKLTENLINFVGARDKRRALKIYTTRQKLKFTI